MLVSSVASGGGSGSTINGVDGSTAASNTNALPTSDVGSNAFATNQVSVAATATVVAAARAGRKAITITNTGTTDVYVGGASVTTSNGTLLAGIKGASLTINTQAAVSAIVASGTQTVSYVETY